MNRAERFLPLIALGVVGAVVAGMYIKSSWDAAEATAAGFQSYSDMNSAAAAGISDPSAWQAHKIKAAAQAKIEQDALALAEQKRRTEEKIEQDRLAADDIKRKANMAEATRQGAALLAEQKRDPALSMSVKSFSWKKSGFGSIALVTFTIRNDNDFPVKDIGVFCYLFASSGTKLSNPTGTIYDTIKAKSERTFVDFNMGFIHSQSRKGDCGVLTARRL